MSKQVVRDVAYFLNNYFSKTTTSPSDILLLDYVIFIQGNEDITATQASGGRSMIAIFHLKIIMATKREKIKKGYE